MKIIITVNIMEVVFFLLYTYSQFGTLPIPNQQDKIGVSYYANSELSSFISTFTELDSI